MRLTTVILIATIMQVSGTGFAQKISLLKTKATLKTVFREIKAQSGYNFLYTDDQLKDSKLVNINVDGAALEEVLREIFKDQPLTYFIDSKTVVIKEKEPTIIDRVKSFFQQDSVIFKGQVLNEYGMPLPGATVKVVGTKKVTHTTNLGSFSIYASPNAKLQVTYIGYTTQELQMRREDAAGIVKFNMKAATKDLGEVAIVSNGYQDIPKERATGSFELITKEQLQHSTDPNLLRRLEGITTSMDFRNDQVRTNSANRSNILSRSPLTNLTIRGTNTLGGATNTSENNSGRPLVVIDGIASPYSIDLVNPNDVESISILKDAAAASIWGSRAANGVIVIKTRKGRYKTPLKVEFNANLNVTEKPDLFYLKTMSTSDYIDAQLLKYNQDYPNPGQHTPDPLDVKVGESVLSPVVEIMDRQRRGQISPDQAKTEIDALRGKDVRNDLNKYFYRNAVTQSYALSISGGTEKLAQRLSAGYDKTINNTINSDNNRMVINYSASAKPIAKLDLQADVRYILSNANGQSGFEYFDGTISPVAKMAFYPYTSLADDQGNPVTIPKKYRQGLLDLVNTTYGDKLFSFDYKPLEDINQGYNKARAHNVNFSLGATYQLLPELSANLQYNYNISSKVTTDLRPKESWYMRNKLNMFTNPIDALDLNILAATGEFIYLTPGIRNLPVGAQYAKTINDADNQTLRGQLNFNKTWNERHSISAIAGMDIYKSYGIENRNSYYGYDEKDLSYALNLNYNNSYFLLLADPESGGSISKLDLPITGMAYQNTRTISYFTNAAYTYSSKYTLSASFRRDLSSIYSTVGNSGGTPFYSLGASWIINQEKFYNFTLLPLLKLRATFGYNGNTNPATSALSRIQLYPQPQDQNGLGYAYILNPTNIKLRPEKTAVLNFGLDFGVKGGRLSGSVDYYEKRTTDLLTGNAAEPSLGFSDVTSNSGDLFGHGLELTLNRLNVQSGQFRWTSNFLFSYNRVKVTRIYAPIVRNAGYLVESPTAVTQGDDVSRLFAYYWAGLDPNTGDPRGYVNGEIKTIDNSQAGTDAYNAIRNQPRSSLRNFGSAVPVYYGSLRNTFSYGNFSLSANVLYKLGYWFRKSLARVVQYNYLYTDGNLQPAEYNNRWKNPGDEKFTNVPSASFPGNPNKDAFYRNSEINVLKGDHIRLQEVNLSYVLAKKNWFIQNPRIYANVSNLGVIWRANKERIDPDVFDYPLARTYSLGFSANF